MKPKPKLVRLHPQNMPEQNNMGKLQVTVWGCMGVDLKSLWILSLCAAFAALTGLTPACAQDGEANAAFTTPVQIMTIDDLVFGTVIVPLSGSCTYAVPASGSAIASGASGCEFVSGLQAPAGFEVGCGANVLTRYEVFYDNLAPAGANFSSGVAPMKIDGHNAGGPLQIHPCDSDGLSLVSLGGVLTVSSSASDGFSGRVGTIRLEAVYD